MVRHQAAIAVGHVAVLPQHHLLFSRAGAGAKGRPHVGVFVHLWGAAAAAGKLSHYVRNSTLRRLCCHSCCCFCLHCCCCCSGKLPHYVKVNAMTLTLPLFLLLLICYCSGSNLPHTTLSSMPQYCDITTAAAAIISTIAAAQFVEFPAKTLQFATAADTTIAVAAATAAAGAAGASCRTTSTSMPRRCCCCCCCCCCQ